MRSSKKRSIQDTDSESLESFEHIEAQERSPPRTRSKKKSIVAYSPIVVVPPETPSPVQNFPLALLPPPPLLDDDPEDEELYKTKEKKKKHNQSETGRRSGHRVAISKFAAALMDLAKDLTSCDCDEPEAKTIIEAQKKKITIAGYWQMSLESVFLLKKLIARLPSTGAKEEKYSSTTTSISITTNTSTSTNFALVPFPLLTQSTLSRGHVMAPSDTARFLSGLPDGVAGAFLTLDTLTLLNGNEAFQSFLIPPTHIHGCVFDLMRISAQDKEAMKSQLRAVSSSFRDFAVFRTFPLESNYGIVFNTQLVPIKFVLIGDNQSQAFSYACWLIILLLTRKP